MNRLALKAKESQRQASHPEANVWVSASAGSGKTKVLCDRILNLLLEGVPPQRILCLTFTNAAAAEMANRLQERVGEWAVCEFEKLVSDIQDLRDIPPSPEQLARARTLFDVVLESPGGLKIQTLHGFCQSLLKRFPLESGLPPHFQVVDEMESQLLLKEAQKRLFENPPSLSSRKANAQSCAMGYPGSISTPSRGSRISDLQPKQSLGASAFRDDDDRDSFYFCAISNALAFLLEEISETAFSNLMSEILAERRAWERFFKKFPSPRSQETAFKAALEIPDEESFSVSAFWTRCDENRLLATTQLLGQGSATEIERAIILSEAYQSLDFKSYQSGFLTQKGEIRARLYTQGFSKSHPEAAQFLDEEASRILEFQKQQKIFQTYARSKSLAQYAQGLLAIYQHLKSKKCVLDYDDLILETLALLQSPGTAPWVLYKFDGGIDHIMIDEAQDTSPSQWEVIQALTEEFFSSSLNKTLFVVGDEKQSIYSFQGADPETFSDMKSFFKTRALEKERAWVKVGLGISFRSAPEILEAVDAVFQNVPMLSKEVQDDIHHDAFRSQVPGHVEVWPLTPQSKKAELEPWALVVDRKNQISPRARLAQKLAKTIKEWLENNRWLEGQNRPVRPGDILILVRKRGAFVEDMIHFLKEENVPVAGIDRLRLNEHIVTQDVKALFEFMLLPTNDLALATVLKSPFVGMSDEDLFTLAWNRGKGSLWKRLQAPQFQPIFQKLSSIRDESQKRTPFTFLMWLLGPQKMREKFTARLGVESQDAFDEILALTLKHEKDHIPTFQGFLNWLEQGNLEIKRDLEEKNEVRVMTVHGSKGLQAPIVILPDTTQIPSDYPSFSFDPELGLPLWLSPQSEICANAGKIKFATQDKQLYEYRRLLYVAMTRAQDELYVAGWESGRSLSENSWYQMIQNGIAPRSELLPFEGDAEWKGDKHVISSQPLASQKTTQETNVHENVEIPQWLFETYCPPPSPSKKLRPSLLSSCKVQNSSALQKGILLHTLLESLPEVSPEKRENHIETTMIPEGYPASEIQKVTEMLLDILESYPQLFDGNSHGEVPISGQMGEHKIAGQVDRLVITPTHVQIIDYKTTSSPPQGDAIPENHLVQLAIYAHVLQEIYPTHVIHCGILWTEIPRLDWIQRHLIQQKQDEILRQTSIDEWALAS